MLLAGKLLPGRALAPQMHLVLPLRQAPPLEDSGNPRHRPVSSASLRPLPPQTLLGNPQPPLRPLGNRLNRPLALAALGKRTPRALQPVVYSASLNSSRSRSNRRLEVLVNPHKQTLSGERVPSARALNLPQAGCLGRPQPIPSARIPPISPHLVLVSPLHRSNRVCSQHLSWLRCCSNHATCSASNNWVRGFRYDKHKRRWRSLRSAPTEPAAAAATTTTSHRIRRFWDGQCLWRQ